MPKAEYGWVAMKEKGPWHKARCAIEGDVGGAWASIGCKRASESLWHFWQKPRPRPPKQICKRCLAAEEREGRE